MAGAPEEASARARPAKLRRWVDLIAALLRRRYGVTFEELSREVPGYAGAASRGAVTRMFERDKDELRRFGVPIETVHEEEGEAPAYVLRRRDFYLPYLAAKGSGAERGGGLAERPGYRDLARVVFELDELAALDEAAMRVLQLGEPLLAADAHAAIRKLAFDLPAGTFVVPALRACVRETLALYQADARQPSPSPPDPAPAGGAPDECQGPPV